MGDTTEEVPRMPRRGTTPGMRARRILSEMPGAIWQTDLENRKFWACGKTAQTLPPGYYSVLWEPNIGRYLSREDLSLDELVRPGSLALDELLVGLSKFWDSSETFKKLGLVHKRGVLLYGPAGSGKSSLCLLIAADVIARGGVVVKFRPAGEVGPGDIVRVLHEIRQRQEDTPIVVLMEDIDQYMSDHQSESVVLNLIDGADSIEKAVFVATTNFAEELGDRIANRPSRFDWRILVGPASREDRWTLLSSLYRRAELGAPDESWIDDTEGFTMADLKELFILVHVFNGDYQASLAKVRELADKLRDSQRRSTPIGFQRPETATGRSRRAHVSRR